MIKPLIMSMLLLVVVIVLAIGYLWITYTSITITEGSAYGVSIGMNKEDVYKEARKYIVSNASDRSVLFTELNVSSDDRTLDLVSGKYLLQFYYIPANYPHFEKQDKWTFFLEKNRTNSITFSFCDRKLCEIYRHRQYFELP